MTAYSLPALLKKYEIHPRKGLGQNFLTDPYHLEKIVEAAELKPHDTVLEIGPGPGSLTRLLVETAGRVVAVELDPAMVNLLRHELGHHSNLTIIEADILKVEPADLLPSSPDIETKNSENDAYKVVANLPYYITSAAIRQLLEAETRPERLVLTVQKEVAQRIVAQPGQMSILAVSVQFYGLPQLMHHIPAGAFFPPPKVDSAVLRIDTYPQLPLWGNDPDTFFRVVKAGFSQKRKQLKNTLSAGLRQSPPEILAALRKAGIEPTRRAQTLSLAEWGQLAETIPK